MSSLNAALFNRELRRQPSLVACGDLFQETISPLGFDTFACGEVDFKYRDRSAFHIIGWPPAWTKFYMSSGLVARDPLVDELQYRTEPYSWTDLRADRKLSKAGTEALNIAAAAGWTEGFAIPLRQSSHRIGLVSMVGHRDCTDPAERDYLTLIGICLHSYARTLLARDGFALSPAGLTEREIGCLRLAAQGKSDASIASELGIAQSTAHEFIEKAKKRMNVRTRTELVAIAAALGIAEI